MVFVSLHLIIKYDITTAKENKFCVYLFSKDKETVLALAEKGHELKESKDLVKDPFVLEFLDIKENTDYLESNLEKNILEHLKEFLLELGKGFMFVGSQVKLTLEEDHIYPDLVFYNRLLKCFVIIDLKIGKVTHQDIGQMQMYVNYYDRGNVDSKYKSIYLDILNQADMQIDKYGNDVGYTKRLEDIKAGYGEESIVYINCKRLIRKILDTNFDT